MQQLGLGGEGKSPIKILQRPKPDQSEKTKKSPSELNVNSQPFVPRNIRTPIIQMEDSTRTQYPQKLVILQRDKSTTTTGNCIESRPIGSGLKKSYEEREAEYKKARERILGSASPSNDESTAVTAVGPVRPFKAAPLPTAEVPRLLRQPQGPTSTGGRGFSNKK